MKRKHKGQSKAFMARIRKLRGKRKVYNRSSPVMSMARRRRSSPRRLARARRSFRSYSHRSTNVMGLVIGEAGFLAYRAFLAPTLSSAVGASTVPIIETVGGLLLSKSRNKYIKYFGTVAFVIGSYSLMVQYLSPVISSIGGASSSGSMGSSPYYG